MSLIPGGASKKPEKLIPNKGLRDFIDSQPCVYCAAVNPMLRRHGRISHHHIKTIGSGGKDENNMIPVHWHGCHAIAHNLGIDRFEEACGRDLREYAKQLTDEYNAPSTMRLN